MRSSWRALRNERALERLSRARSDLFPGEVWTHALRRSLLPPTLSRAVESYWRHHPIRADRIARALARRSGSPNGWKWQLRRETGDEAPVSFRTPPAPYRASAFSKGPGYCCICGQPVFRFGWHADLWRDGGPNRRAQWHAACVQAWKFWNAPSDEVAVLKRLQQHRCASTGRPLLKTAEVDHRTPLFKVWRKQRDMPWPDLLAFWGLPNLQVINREAHMSKCLEEARDRASARRSGKAVSGLAPSLTSARLIFLLSSAG